MQQATNGDTPPRVRRIREVTQQCLRRRQQGEALSDKDVIDANPELMPELADELRHLRIVHAALEQPSYDVERQALHDGNPQPTATPRSLHVRCPLCQTRLEIPTDSQLDNITCSSCGSCFSLVQDETTTRAAPTVTMVGHFELIERLGIGGFGTVWKARDTHLDRAVAVKIPRRGELERAEVEQFLREARAAAQLNHPNIVRIYEVGRDGETVYIVSDLVRGISLADRLSTGEGMSAREAASLCVKMAEALGHAHQAGVIHRDLKPQNVMLDSRQEPHLMDFGLARRDTGEMTMTVDGQVLGTPAYMSPEQARGEAHHADDRTDIYSLGVILFEMLTGELPFRGNARMLIHQVLNEEAPSPRKLNGSVPRDLETVCQKCLEKDPNKRYEAAHDLAIDLRRFLRGEPITARPISAVARGWRWCKRNQLPSALALGLAIALASGLVASSIMWLRADKAAQENFELNYFASMDLAGRAWEAGNYDQVLRILKHYQHPGHYEDSRGIDYFLLSRLCERGINTFSIENDVPVEDVAVSPNGEYVAFTSLSSVHVWQNDRRAGFQPRYEFEHSVNVVALAISPDGTTLATGDQSGALSFHDLSTGDAGTPIAYNKNSFQLRGLTFSKTGDFLAGIVGGSIRLWDPKGTKRETVGPIAQTVNATCVAVSSDGQTLATGHKDAMVRLWSTNGEFIDELPGSAGHVTAVAFHPNRDLLAFGAKDKTVRIWGTEHQRLVRELKKHAGEITALEFSADGNTLWTGSADNTIRRWDVNTWTQQDEFRGHLKWILSMSVTSKGDTLVLGSWDGKVKIWNVGENPAMRVIASHAGTVNSISISKNGSVLASGGDDGTVRWSKLESSNEAEVLVFGESILAVAVSPDGTRIAAFGSNTLFVLGTESKDRVFEHPFGRSGNATTSAARPIEPDPSRWFQQDVEFIGDDRVAIAATDGFHVWDINTKQKLRTPSILEPRRLAVSLGNRNPARYLAVGSHVSRDYEFAVNIYDAISYERKRQLPGFLGTISSIEFSADGRTLAVGGMGEELRLYDVKKGTLNHKLDVTQAHVASIAFSPDGKILAAAESEYSITGNGRVSLWDVGTGRRRFSIRVDGQPRSIAFTPNGQSLAVAVNNEVVLYQAASHDEAEQLLGD